jgi:hypothetical protein
LFLLPDRPVRQERASESQLLAKEAGATNDPEFNGKFEGLNDGKIKD